MIHEESTRVIDEFGSFWRREGGEREFSRAARADALLTNELVKAFL